MPGILEQFKTRSEFIFQLESGVSYMLMSSQSLSIPSLSQRGIITLSFSRFPFDPSYLLYDSS